ncbi:MAG: hypothetical protein JWR01_760 [Subtercola sp.]|nr:hypothetical protein [Subtercola sp.]
MLSDYFADISRILFEADPVGINFSTNSDEYDPEASAILAKLGSVDSVASLQACVHSVFVEWFDASLAGPVGRYENIAQDIWALVCDDVI